MKLSASDVLIFLGLILVWIGLFYWFGLGVATTVAGVISLAYGVAAKFSEHE